MADKETNLNDVTGALFRQGYTADSDGISNNQRVDVRSSVPITANTTPVAAAFTDGSGSIAVNATSQQIFAANAARKYLFIQNNSADTLWINFGVAAVQTQPSIKLLPNAAYESLLVVSNQTVNVIGPNAGATFTAKQA